MTFRLLHNLKVILMNLSTIIFKVLRWIYMQWTVKNNNKSKNFFLKKRASDFENF